MKLIIAFLAASVAAVAHADQCDLTKLSPLLTNPAVKTCTEQSKYTFVPPTRPTDEQLTAICKSDACKQVLGVVAAMGLPDCEIGTVSVKKDLLERVSTGCAALANGGSNATTSAPSAATTAPSATTPAPSSTTATPVPTATTTNGTSSNSTTTAPPAATTAAPSDKSGAQDMSGDEEESSASGSADTAIEPVEAIEEETSAPATPKSKTPTPAPASGTATSAVAATVCVASLVGAVALV